MPNRSVSYQPGLHRPMPLVHEIKSRIFQALIGVGLLELGMGLYRLLLLGGGF